MEVRAPERWRARGRFRADARAASAGRWLNKTVSEADLLATATLRILICTLARVFRIAPRSTIGLPSVYHTVYHCNFVDADSAKAV